MLPGNCHFLVLVNRTGWAAQKKSSEIVEDDVCDNSIQVGTLVDRIITLYLGTSGPLEPVLSSYNFAFQGCTPAGSSDQSYLL